VRIVRTPAGTIEIDETGKMNGRGAYVCRDLACWRGSLGRHGLGRALASAIPPELRERLAAGPDEPQTTGGGIRGQE
jgi:predicted RNA-binding protein YlxR (DUF448 family)